MKQAACRMSPAICHGLQALGVRVVCIDARQAHQSLKALKANKTDPHDAAGLAQLARTGFYKEVHVKSPAAHCVRSVITARNHLIEARVRLVQPSVSSLVQVRARHSSTA
ncbi:transposase [Mesorhizobium sp. M0159]|uniref:IS110 family transposase n=1 Tax=Mesorhizobium sp. M0159 TaxID=2956900 RepID=UPI00333D5921